MTQKHTESQTFLPQDVLGTVTATAQGMNWNNVVTRLSLTTGDTILALAVLPKSMVLAALMSAVVTRLLERCR